MTDRWTTRRAVLSRGGTLASLGLAAALAGCGDGGGDGDGDGSDGENDDGGSGDDGTSDPPTATDTPTETETATETAEQPEPQLEILDTVGSDLTEDGVGTVEVTVTRSQSAGTVELRSMTVQFNGPRSEATLWHESVSGNSNTVFRTAPVDGGPGSGAILADADDRTVVSFDLGAGGATERLRPSETATVELRLERGGATSVELVVPPSLDGEEETVPLTVSS